MRFFYFAKNLIKMAFSPHQQDRQRNSQLPMHVMHTFRTGQKGNWATLKTTIFFIFILVHCCHFVACKMSNRKYFFKFVCVAAACKKTEPKNKINDLTIKCCACILQNSFPSI